MASTVRPQTRHRDSGMPLRASPRSTAALGVDSDILSRHPHDTPTIRMQSTLRWRFGPFEADAAEHRLLRDGDPVPVTRKSFALLACLLSRPGRLFTKAELFDTVWAGMVVTDAALSRVIHELRVALGDDANSPRYIATAHGLGFRFVALVSIVRDVSKPNEHTASADQRGLPLATNAQSAAKPVTPINSNFPAVLRPLYGRDVEVQEVVRLLERHPLISIVGAGGIGKTRLSHAVAHEMQERFGDGVWLIELAAVSEPGRVIATVAQVLKLTVRDQADSLDAVVDALRGKCVLLVLDNCEHLLGAVSTLAEAIQSHNSTVGILVTSQEPLKVSEEHVYRLGTLPVPYLHELLEADAALQYGAIALFVARAEAADPRFSFSAHNVEAILDICRRLDGIALAIEFAAARVSLLGVEGLCRRLNERFNILSSGHRGAPRRHQTLRAALEWSYSLLTDAQRVVFRRLSVFAGGFALESAQEVAADQALDKWQVLDHLAALVDKSLLVVGPANPPRYHMLQTTRLFATQQLVAADEQASIARRHSHCFAALFEAAWAERWDARSAELYKCLQPELDNLRTALDWSSRNDPDLEISLAGATPWLWLGSGLDAEGIAACEQAISHVGKATSPALEARLLSEMAQLGWYMLSLKRALQVLDRAIALYRSSGDRVGLYLALARKAGFLASGGEVDHARHALLEMETLETKTWPVRLRLERLIARVRVAWFDSNLDAFLATHEERYRFACAVGNERDRLLARGNLVNAKVGLGQLEQALRDGRELVDQFRRHGLAGAYLGYLLAHLAIAFALLGRLDEALVDLREATPQLRAGAMMWRLLDLFALIALLRGSSANAARLFGAGDAIFTRRGRRREISLERLHDVVAKKLSGTLPPEELARLLSEGETMSEREAVLAALSEVDFGKAPFCVTPMH